MYVLVGGIQYRALAFALAENRYGDVYYSTTPEPHLKFEKEEDAVAFSIATGLKAYKQLGDNHAL